MAESRQLQLSTALARAGRAYSRKRVSQGFEKVRARNTRQRSAHVVENSAAVECAETSAAHARGHRATLHRFDRGNAVDDAAPRT
jgi:hypothetical protein